MMITLANMAASHDIPLYTSDLDRIRRRARYARSPDFVLLVSFPCPFPPVAAKPWATPISQGGSYARSGCGRRYPPFRAIDALSLPEHPVFPVNILS